MRDSQRQYAERKKFELSKWTVLWMKILGICVHHKSFSSSSSNNSHTIIIIAIKQWSTLHETETYANAKSWLASFMQITWMFRSNRSSTRVWIPFIVMSPKSIQYKVTMQNLKPISTLGHRKKNTEMEHDRLNVYRKYGYCSLQSRVLQLYAYMLHLCFELLVLESTIQMFFYFWMSLMAFPFHFLGIAGFKFICKQQQQQQTVNLTQLGKKRRWGLINRRRVSFENSIRMRRCHFK